MVDLQRTVTCAGEAEVKVSLGMVGLVAVAGAVSRTPHHPTITSEGNVAQCRRAAWLDELVESVQDAGQAEGELVVSRTRVAT